jgi:hypothetical protein
MGKGFYYIENTVDEYHSRPSAFFDTLEEAKNAMKLFGDWFLGNGTGRIYFQRFGIVKKHSDYANKDYVVAHKYFPKFICRGKGLDRNGEIIWVDTEF